MRKKRKPMDLLRARQEHVQLHRRLARARHLYFALFYRDIVKTVSFGRRAEERMIEVGLRMRERGFYAKTTSRLNLGLSVAGNMAREREKRYGDQFLWRIKHTSRMPYAVDRVAANN